MNDGTPVTEIRNAVLNIHDGTHTIALILSGQGWMLSAAARSHHLVFKAIVHVAHCELHLQRCIGGRIGR
eukprot:3619997-Heterocapsa_arctica.AAC.1